MTTDLCCTDKYLDEDLVRSHVPSHAQSIALLQSKKWPVGSTINIKLINPTKQQEEEVQECIDEWMKYVNIDFKINGAFDSAIRITFDRNGGAWSMLGTDSARSRRSQATMNLGFNQPGTYLHEFGHALGAIHEHCNPRGGIKWNRQAVIRDLSGPPNNWDMQTIENNMFRRYDIDQTNGSEVDTNSIMLYAIPRRWTLDGFSSTPNAVLSDRDKQFAREQYPGVEDVRTVDAIKVIDIHPQAASFVKPGERDIYELQVQGGHYVLESFGELDIVMQLFHGSDLITQDDNSGLNKNARIECDLAEGHYTVQVSHNGDGPGQYGIRALHGPISSGVTPTAVKSERIDVESITFNTVDGPVEFRRT